MDEVAAQTVEAMLVGMGRLGIDVATIRARAALPCGPPALGDRWPGNALAIAWMYALSQLPRPDLPAEVGLAVPFGAFGMIDYLIASSDTMGGGLYALLLHFQGKLGTPSLSLVDEAEGVRLEVRLEPNPMTWVGEEFTLALTLKNCRHVAAAPVPVTEVCTTRPGPGSSALASLLDAPVRYGCPVASLHFGASMMHLPLRTADPYLHSAIRSLAASLSLGDSSDPLEQAIRARLRDTLPDGDAAAATVARGLGMSERTLHRRLQERGTTWRAVIDAFRCDESKRLLRDPRRTQAEIALSLGFSEQTAWARAFRRWTGRSPARWAREHPNT